jgi:hypothetical protein
MPIELAMAITCMFDADTWAKQFKICKVGFYTIVPLEQCFLHFWMNQPIVKINGMKEHGRPVLCRKTWTKEECTHTHGKFVIVNLDCPVLGWAVSAGGFKCVVEFLKEEILKAKAKRKFASLVRTDATSVFVAVMM